MAYFECEEDPQHHIEETLRDDMIGDCSHKIYSTVQDIFQDDECVLLKYDLMTKSCDDLFG